VSCDSLWSWDQRLVSVKRETHAMPLAAVFGEDTSSFATCLSQRHLLLASHAMRIARQSVKRKTHCKTSHCANAMRIARHSVFAMQRRRCLCERHVAKKEVSWLTTPTPRQLLLVPGVRDAVTQTPCLGKRIASTSQRHRLLVRKKVLLVLR